MTNRPNSFDPATPLGTASPRDGDNELRRIKLLTQNGWNDMTNPDRDAVGQLTHPLFSTDLDATGDLTVSGTSTLTAVVTAPAGIVGDTTGIHNGAVGSTTPAAGTFTTLNSSTVNTSTVTALSAIVNGFTVTSGGTNILDVRVGTTTVFRISSTGNITALGDITSNAGAAI